MSAIFEALDILCRNCVSCTGGNIDCHEVVKMREAIAEAQLEVVEEYIKHEELAHAVAYLAALRKAAGK